MKKKWEITAEISFYNVIKALEYDPARPETSTGSPFLDEIIRKLKTYHPTTCKEMARHFRMRPEWFSGAIHCLVGVSYGELHDLWAHDEYLRLKKLHPDWEDSRIAPQLGFADSASLWHFKERCKLLERQMVIVQATAEHIPEIQAMANVVFRRTYADILSPEQMEYMMNWMYSEESLRGQIEGEGKTAIKREKSSSLELPRGSSLAEDKAFFIATDGAPLGYVSVEFERTLDDGRPLFHLQKIYVMPKAQRDGVGRKLFQHVIEWLKQRNPSGCRVELNVNRQNPAVHFYEKMGMRLDRQGDFPIGNGFYMNDFIYAMDVE